MLTKSDDLAVTMTVSADHTHAAIVLAGDLDLVAVPDLADTVRRLSAGVPETVTVDLSAVTFACAVLPNYLARVRQAIPHTAGLTVLRPTHMVRFLLHATDMAQIATIDRQVPASKVA